MGTAPRPALGIGRRFGGLSLANVPVQDAFAWIIADDELEGAHRMSADTDARFARVSG